MTLRSTLLALGIAAASSPALAHEGCQGDCYTLAPVPARYGLVVEKEIVRAPRTYALYAPAEYRTVYERVLVRPAGRAWVVRPGRYGEPVGCWVETPAAYTTVPHRVLTRRAVLEPFTQTAAYGFATAPVLVEPAHAAWVPVRR